LLQRATNTHRKPLNFHVANQTRGCKSLWKSTMCIDSRAWITSYRDTCAWLGKYLVN